MSFAAVAGMPPDPKTPTTNTAVKEKPAAMPRDPADDTSALEGSGRHGPRSWWPGRWGKSGHAPPVEDSSIHRASKSHHEKDDNTDQPPDDSFASSGRHTVSDFPHPHTGENSGEVTTSDETLVGTGGSVPSSGSSAYYPFFDGSRYHFYRGRYFHSGPERSYIFGEFDFF